MLPRILRTSVATVRRFSTKTAAPIQKRLSREGETEAGDRPSSAGTGRDTLGRRLFGLVYKKRSAVVTIRKWKEEGHVVRKYELNRIVRELRRLKRYKHALEVQLHIFQLLIFFFFFLKCLGLIFLVVCECNSEMEIPIH